MKKNIRKVVSLALVMIFVLGMLSTPTAFAYNTITKTNEGIHIFEAVIEPDAEESKTWFTFRNSDGTGAWPTLLHISGDYIRLDDGRTAQPITISFNSKKSHHVMVAMTLAGDSGNYPTYNLYINGVKKTSSVLKNASVNKYPYLDKILGGYLDYTGKVDDEAAAVAKYSANLTSNDSGITFGGDFDNQIISINGIYTKEALISALSGSTGTVSVNCANNNKVSVDDTVTVVSENGKVTNVYTVASVAETHTLTKTNKGTHVFEAVVGPDAEESKIWFTFRNSAGTGQWPILMYVSGECIKIDDGKLKSTLKFNSDEAHHVMLALTLAGDSGNYPTYNVYVNGVKKVSSELRNASVQNYPYLEKILDGCLQYVCKITDEASYASEYSALLSSNDASVEVAGVFDAFVLNLSREYTRETLSSVLGASEGASVTVNCADESKVNTGDTVSVVSANGKVTNVYKVVNDIAMISSDVYSISKTEGISGVYEFTKVSEFLAYIEAQSGCEVKLVKSGIEVTEGIVEEGMTVEVSDESGNKQEYSINIDDRKNITTSTSSYVYEFPTQLPASKSSFRGNMIIELKTKVMHGYYTGPNSNSAFYVACDDEGTKLGMFKNIWEGNRLTDLDDGEDITLTFVVKPAADGENNQFVYFINGDFAGECSMSSIESKIWTKWRIHKGTKAEFFMVENLSEYYKSKNINKLSIDGNSLKVNFAGSEAERAYLAVYSGNKLESIKTIDLSDFSYDQDVITIDDNYDGKTVKAFLWSSDLKPIDSIMISNQANILFDREFEFS